MSGVMSAFVLEKVTDKAAGGTEMIPPMRAALTDHHADGNTVRQVVILTDGCIGNEQQLFDMITSMRGRGGHPTTR